MASERLWRLSAKGNYDRTLERTGNSECFDVPVLDRDDRLGDDTFEILTDAFGAAPMQQIVTLKFFTGRCATAQGESPITPRTDGPWPRQPAEADPRLGRERPG